MYFLTSRKTNKNKNVAILAPMPTQAYIIIMSLEMLTHKSSKVMCIKQIQLQKVEAAFI